MTDIELKEKARQYVYNDPELRESMYVAHFIRVYMDAYKAGSTKEIIWHDTDLNPDDLPTNKDPVWNEDGEMVYFDIDEKQWRRWRSNRQLSIHAWAKVISYPPF